MLLYCVRHGESEYNAEGRIQGQSDIPLSPLGRRQGMALAGALSPFPITAVFCSPLARARETARPLAEKLNLPLQFDDRLKEIHAGIFQGLRWSEIEQSHPAEAARWLAKDPDFIVPGGESRRALMERGRRAFEFIRESGHKHAAVIAHGGVLTAAFKALLGIDAGRSPFSLYNASISKLAWDKEFRLLTLNEVEHLAAVNEGRLGHSGDL